MSKDSPSGGNPCPRISSNSSARKRNVGAGLAPALQPPPAQQTPPALLNSAQQPSPAHQTPPALFNSAQQPPPAHQTPPTLLNSAHQPSSEWLNPTLHPFADGLHQLGL